ncbi:putative MFS family arabinose efflux permease [Microbacterium sp. SLBN-154]|nr:putative MFS family arabinose efflux permease [Microbacterium sp. SLBN-154]
MLVKVKRSFSFYLTVAATTLIAATYGLARFAYGLHLPGMQAELGFDSAVAGAIFAGGSIAYCVGAVCGFGLAPRCPRTLVALAGATAALGTTGVAIAPSTAWLAPGAVLASTGAGLASPALVRVIQRNLRREAADRAQSIVNAGTGPGLIAAGILALALLPQWRAAWWMAAAVSVVAATAVLLLDRQRDSVPTLGLPPAAWWRAHRMVIVGALLMGVASAAVWNFGRTMLTDAGLADGATVLAWVALGVGGLAVVPTAGLLAVRPPPRVWALTVVVLALATATLVAAPATVGFTLAACVVFGWAYVASTGALIGWTALLKPARAASGTALLFVLLVLGQAVGGAILGLVVGSAGYPTAFLAAAAVAIIAAGAGVVRSRPGARRNASPRTPDAMTSGR